MGFWLLDLASGDAREVGREVLPADGHCSYRPGGRYVLMDTQPGADGLRCLLVYDEEAERARELGRFHSRRATLARSAATCTRAGAVTAGRSVSTPFTKAAARCM